MPRHHTEAEYAPGVPLAVGDSYEIPPDPDHEIRHAHHTATVINVVERNMHPQTVTVKCSCDEQWTFANVEEEDE